MNKIVFLEPDKIDAVPFTTSDIIAEQTNNSYRSIQRTIERQEKRLEKFGRVRFQITPFETKGGIQNKKIYHLNEPQATLLITFLKNNDIVADFKVELVRQFYAMRNELQMQQLMRAELNPIRRELTDAIKDTPDHPHKSWDYKHFTDLAYKNAIGKTAAQLRKERNAQKTAIALDYLNSQELESVTKSEYRIAVLVDMGMDYQQVKSILANARIKTVSA